ncbi:tumor protein p53-inducible nuclear protein 2 isoform X2 [Misgurnus anguillicaudatus]|uniref:tumor protein p53-inducible nuclear protein 2 isoform X2 n=1 Tax=Misgurnus anguillicaudatus TaxID=75329 RepID=UPI002435FEC9|nr:tumor protein p53-inducible nuclear protein 2 isoform X2 [Misgurnus anguillicaudatus]
MFQRLSDLFFGSVEQVTPELSGPKPSVTEADEEGWLLVNLPEGATAEASPMEDLLIEHPSMSVYVSPGHLPAMEESAISLAGSVSRMSESALPVTRSSMPTRVTHGAGALTKITKVSRVQRAKARTERRHLGRNLMQRQNRAREQVQRRATHTRNSFLHQPCQRNFCH